jgi:hypothetical protein
MLQSKIVGVGHYLPEKSGNEPRFDQVNGHQ